MIKNYSGNSLLAARVFDLKKNDINGGSITYYICHERAKFQTNLKKDNVKNVLIIGDSIALSLSLG